MWLTDVSTIRQPYEPHLETNLDMWRSYFNLESYVTNMICFFLYTAFLVKYNMCHKYMNKLGTWMK